MALADLPEVLRENAPRAEIAREPLQAPHVALEDPGVEDLLDIRQRLAILVVARRVRGQ